MSVVNLQSDKLVEVETDIDTLTYNGNCFTPLYLDVIIPFAEKELKIGNLGQETYLGYVQELDLFVSGWDTWEDDFDDDGLLEDKTPIGSIALIKIIDNNPVLIDILGWGGDKMYLPYGGYDKIHKKFPTIFDIRLD